MEHSDFESLLRQLQQRAGSTDRIDQLLVDEHDRYQLYRSARSCVAVSELLPVIVADPDLTMGTATLVEVLDAEASDMTFDDFDRWSAALLSTVGDRPFVQRRVAEWLLLKQLGSGDDNQTAELLGATDWLQRKAAEESHDRSVLEVLAESANTRRIRSIAELRLRRQNWG